MGVFASFLFGVGCFFLLRYFPFTSLFLTLSAFSYILWRRRPVLILVALLGVAWAFIRCAPEPSSPAGGDRTIRVAGSFVRRASPPAKDSLPRTFAVDSAFDQDSGEELESVEGEDLTVFTETEPDYDAAYELLFRPGKDRSRLTPGWTGRPGLSGSIQDAHETETSRWKAPSFFDRSRYELNSFALRRFSPDAAALVAAVTTGETSYISRQTREDFNAAGLAHLLSISGSHFGLVSLALFAVFQGLLRLLPYGPLQRLTLCVTPSQASALCCIPVMVFYLGISGGNAPAVRSFVMIGLFLLGLLIGRKAFWLNSLLLAAFVIVAADPAALLTLSFQLSFIAVLFIGFSIDRNNRTITERGWPRVRRAVESTIALTLAASLGTIPLAAYHFHYVSLISPLSNLLVAPLIGFILVPLSLFSSFSYVLTGHHLFAPIISATADISLSMVTALARLPYADVRLPAFPAALCIAFYFACLLGHLLKKRKVFISAAVMPFIIYALFLHVTTKELSVSYLDVGQGDSAVIEFPDGKVAVVDTGRTGRETAAFLRYIGRRDVDVVVLSHSHPDHTGGLGELLSGFRVGEVWDNGLIIYPPQLRAVINRRSLARGDHIAARDYAMTVLHPYPEFYTRDGNDYEAENNSSVVLKIRGRRHDFLFTGDVEDEAESDLSHLGDGLRADVIKVPHHGSRTSANTDFLSYVAPTISVISAGRGNSFGHPHAETIRALAGTTTFRTDRDGAVKINESGAGLSIKTYRDFQFEEAGPFSPGREWKNIKRLFQVW